MNAYENIVSPDQTGLIIICGVVNCQTAQIMICSLYTIFVRDMRMNSSEDTVFLTSQL